MRNNNKRKQYQMIPQPELYRNICWINTISESME